MSMRTSRTVKAAQGKAYDEVSQILLELDEYFDDRADADCEGDPPEFRPNREMTLGLRVCELRDLLGVPE